MARKDNRNRKLKDGESQRKDGRYMYRYKDEMSGKRITVYAKDLKELREKEQKIRKDIDDAILTDSAAKKLTVQTLYERYMRTRVLADTTRQNYENMWNIHVRETLGNMKVVQLNSSHIKTFYKELSDKGYSHSTIKLLHTMLSPALDDAVNTSIIRANPAMKVNLSEYGKKAQEKVALKTEQQAVMLDFITHSNVYSVYEPMIKIMLKTGLRCGELIGLTWNDVNMKAKTIDINHQLIYKKFDDKYQFRSAPPKTEAGKRIINMREEVYELFKKQRELNFKLGKRSLRKVDQYSDFVFLTERGNPMMPSAVNNVIYEIVNRCNEEQNRKCGDDAILLPKISAHNLRHTAACNMAFEGMNVKVLQYIMGHDSVEMTLDVYAKTEDKFANKAEIERLDKKGVS